MAMLVIAVVGLPGVPAEAQTSATFGATSAGGSSLNQQNRVACSKYSTTSTAGTLTAIRFWAIGGATAQSGRGVLYAMSGGVPSTLLAVGSEVTVGVLAGVAAYSSAVSNGPALAPSTTYCLGVMLGSGSASVHHTTATDAGFHRDWTYGSSPPDPAGSMAFNNVRLSVAGDMTVPATTTTAAPRGAPPPEPIGVVPLAGCVNGQAAGECSPRFHQWTGGNPESKPTDVQWSFWREANEVWVKPVDQLTSSLNPSTGPMCVRFWDPVKSVFEYAVYHYGSSGSSAGLSVALGGGKAQISAGNDTNEQTVSTYDKPGSYAFRRDRNRDAEFENPHTNCLATDPFFARTPTLDCSREWFTRGDGSTGVRVRAMVLNATEAAYDVVTIRFPWEQADRYGSIHEASVPTEGVPESGWRGVCKVVRTVRDGVQASTDWLNSDGNGGYVQDVAPEDVHLNPKLAFTTPPAHPALVKAVVAVSALVNAGRGAAGLVGAAAGAAASAGWLAGGYIIGKKGWENDDEWFCRWNPGYRNAKEQYCDTLTNPELKPYTRGQVYLRDANGNPIDPSTQGATIPWKTATAVAEVIIDPRPGARDLGARTTAGLEAPTAEPSAPPGQPRLTTTQTQRLMEAESTEVGQQRATQPRTTTDERVAPGETAAPAPAGSTEASSGPSTECKQSFWEVMNPFNIAETMGCVLRRLFVPKAGAWDSTRQAYNEGVGTLVNHPIGVLSASWAALDRDGEADCAGPTVHVPGFLWDGFDIQPLRACEGTPKTVSDMVRPVMLAMIWLSVVMACARLLGGAFGISVPGRNSDGGE